MAPRIANWKEVEHYIESALKKTERMRQEGAKEKTGIELKGISAINPATKEKVPVWVADYVLIGYGTRAIMAVHIYGLPVNMEAVLALAARRSVKSAIPNTACVLSVRPVRCVGAVSAQPFAVWS